MIAVAIIGLVLSILTTGYSVAVSEYGSKVGRDGLELARDIAKDISKNNAKLNEAYQAWSTKSSKLANSLFQGIGFGPRVNAIVKQMDANDFDYQSVLKQVNSENLSLEQLQNDVQAAVSTSNSLTGARKAASAIEDLKAVRRGEEKPSERRAREKAQRFADTTGRYNNGRPVPTYDRTTDLNQNINGGVTNGGETNV